jgi:hypothetical protein
MGWLDVLAGIATIVRRELGQGFREWAEWATRNPAAAAFSLEVVAGRLEAAAEARRPRRDGRLPWLARRKKATATKLRAQAKYLRSFAFCRDSALAGGAYSGPDPFRRPGT